MALMPLESLAPGMRLQTPLLNPNGVLLLKGGEVLTEKHLTIFKAWGVQEADVVLADGSAPVAPAGATIPPEVMASIQARLDVRFRRSGRAGNPVMAEIYQAVARRIAERQIAQGSA